MKSEKLSMISESAKRQGFKDNILPDLEVLLQFSLALTRNGRDAAELMRDAMEEAYRVWDETMPEENCRMWLHKILTRRFFEGFLQHARPNAPISGANIDKSLIKNRIWPTTATGTRQKSQPTGKSDEDVNYFKAIAGLPAMYRSAMILSYLEGFSNGEIAELAGVRPRAIESVLDRGRRFIREELFAHLMGDDGPDMVVARMAASG
jgi:RNA polymerase sigma-70 factor (ECF subfamily)